MIGWISSSDQTWEEIGHQMKRQLQNSLTRFPIPDWSNTLLRHKEQLISKLEDLPEWTRRVINWDPRDTPDNLNEAFRNVGRPPKRWLDLTDADN